MFGLMCDKSKAFVRRFVILSIVVLLVCGVLQIKRLGFGDGQAYLDSLLEKEPVSVKLWGWGDTVILEEEPKDAFLQMMGQVTVSPVFAGAINKEGAVPASATFLYEDGTSARIGLPLFRAGRGVYCCNLAGVSILDNKLFLDFFTSETETAEQAVLQ